MFPEAFFKPVRTEEKKLKRWGVTPKWGDKLLYLDDFSSRDYIKTDVFDWEITNGEDLGSIWGLKVFLVRKGTVIDTPQYTIKISGFFFLWKATFRKK
jgi:hypothetical protein